jgi:hypothetical protein
MDKTASAIVCDMQIKKALMPANVLKWIVPKTGVCDMPRSIGAAKLHYEVG